MFECGRVCVYWGGAVIIIPKVNRVRISYSSGTAVKDSICDIAMQIKSSVWLLLGQMVRVKKVSRNVISARNKRHVLG